ncbi:MAG TPA: lamin tail domain-containing protein, partial [Candidatus Limnocylindria bacterium]|nr:lamin tail domain-containing protein [Candidatus Limnocylindria bacterium]
MLHLRRARWLPAALLVLLAGALVVNASAVPRPAADPPPLQPLAQAGTLGAQQQAVVDWPPSAGLLVAEVVTGAASASDEFVEIYNASAGVLSLAELELVYVTATGGTVTRKQAWEEVALQPGQHLLLANSAGAYAPLADGLYSGGFAATGGTLVLRSVAGAVIDSLSWGNAASEFVEGSPGLAPPAGSSLERLPGGALGNGRDTNDNLADTHLEPEPLPQGLSAPPVPAPGPSVHPTSPAPTADPTFEPTPAPTQAPTAQPTPEPTQAPTPQPTAPPTVLPTPQPTLSPTPTPSSAPTPTPAPTAQPTPAPTPFPTPAPTPFPTPTDAPALPIADVRALPMGSATTVHGWLTTPTGLTESGSGAFVQDDSAGIALYLVGADWPALPVGTEVTVSGLVETRFSQLTLRLPGPEAISPAGVERYFEPLATLTGEAGEEQEGRLLSISGLISDSISPLADGFSTAVDDGSGSLRVIVASATGVAPELLARGASVRLVGVLGQRDSSGTGMAGYRLHLRSTADVELLPGASPSPTSSAGPLPTPGTTPSPAPPSPSPSPTPGPTPTPSPSPDPQAEVVAVAVARQAAVGARLRVRGVVTVAPGRILGERTIAIQDETAGICVQLPPGDHSDIVPGRLVEVDGVLAAPYGNLELRAGEGGLVSLGNSAQPAARQLDVSAMGEATEGLLARLSATIRRIESGSTGSVTLIVEDGSGEGRVFLHSPLGMSRDDFAVGQGIAATGIVGDRLGLYRLWPRSESDISLLPGGGPPEPGDTPPPSPTDDPPGQPAPITIAQAGARQGQTVTIEATVSTPPGLLDADPRRVAVQDASGAILVRLAAHGPAAVPGQRLRLTGTVGTYYGAPQLSATAPAVVLQRNVALAALRVARAPVPSDLEWRLVTVSGRVDSVRRDGEAWRAELTMDGGGIPIVGPARSGLAATLLAVGRNATVTGIVRRAFPTASDQRLAIVPRSPSDIRLGPGGQEAPGTGGGASTGAPGVGQSAPDGPGVSPPADGSAPPAAISRPLSELAGLEGSRVRVGG